jgi:GNAT superfamily N-acetyltransferase
VHWPRSFVAPAAALPDKPFQRTSPRPPGSAEAELQPRGLAKNDSRWAAIPPISEIFVNVRIRLARPADEDLLLTLTQEFYSVEHLPYDREVARRALQELWDHPEFGRVYLIQSEASVAGYLVLTFGFSLEFHGRDALLDEFYVREAHRGQGLGTASLKRVEEVCRAEGIHALHLEVDHANERAKRLYHRMGYQDHDRHLLTKRLPDAGGCAFQ